MKINNKFYIALLTTIVLPAVSFAALTGLGKLITEFGDVVNLSFRLIFALALAFFFWGIVQFIRNDAGSDKTREEGKKKMLWGVIALFVMFSIYGILAMIGNVTGITVPSNNQQQNSGGLPILPNSQKA